MNGAERFFDRFANWLGRLFVAFDQLFSVWARGWLYVWLNKGGLPSADETLSSFVGRMAIAGHKTALIAEKVIDSMMGRPGHCRAAIARDFRD